MYVGMYVCMYGRLPYIYMIFFINLESAAAVAIVVVEVRYKRKYKQVIGQFVGCMYGSAGVG